MVEQNLIMMERPLKCVCNLCDCGSHTCSNFVSSPGESKAYNGCDDCPINGANVNTQLIETSRQSLMSNGRNYTARGCCFGDERYLMGSRFLGSAYKSEPQAEGCLQVLITRPEVASKPRDNIVLEGDMDLKTTFETSYEALARARLEGWKRYQELMGADHGGQIAQELDDERKVDNKADCRSRGLIRKEVSSPSPIDGPSGEVAGGLVDSNEYRAKIHPHETFEKRYPIRAAADHKRVLEVDGHVARESADFVGGSKTDLPQYGPQFETDWPRESISPHQTTNTAYVDPDLTPLIVYDANLNRLEKMGMRKRSEYRPSTSLRSGSRGLFGDQDEDSDPTIDPQHQQTLSAQEASLAARHQIAAGCRRDGSEYNATGGRFQPDRNLVESHQDDYLTFTRRNVPVDSKRKVRDNVNMIDHIKEQNIVESSPQIRDARENFDHNHVESQQEADERVIQENEDNLAKAKDADEMALAPETHRISNLSVAQKAGEETRSAVSIREDDTRADRDMRKSRLFRTCQNQNFDIFHNNYPDSVLDNRADPSAEIELHSSPQPISQHETALADANPLTVSHRSKHNPDQDMPGMDARDSCSDLDGKSMEVGSKSPADCKVSNIDDDYQYVGSRNGHKYFVQKQQSR